MASMGAEGPKERENSTARKLGLEGAVSKRPASRYVHGRTRDWLPLGSFPTLDMAIAWCVGRHYNIQVNVGDDKWINVEQVELSN
jgi:hypothetical protein